MAFQCLDQILSSSATAWSFDLCCRWLGRPYRMKTDSPRPTWGSLQSFVLSYWTAVVIYPESYLFLRPKKLARICCWEISSYWYCSRHGLNGFGVFPVMGLLKSLTNPSLPPYVILVWILLIVVFAKTQGHFMFIVLAEILFWYGTSLVSKHDSTFLVQTRAVYLLFVLYYIFDLLENLSLPYMVQKRRIRQMRDWRVGWLNYEGQKRGNYSPEAVFLLVPQTSTAYYRKKWTRNKVTPSFSISYFSTSQVENTW